MRALSTAFFVIAQNLLDISVRILRAKHETFLRTDDTGRLELRLMADKESAESGKAKKIREYILKTGYPLEIEIGNILRKNGWLVGNQWPYLDKKDGKIRAIDILAMRMRPQQPQLGLLMIVECKKGEKHEWAFYTQQKENEFLPMTGALVDLVRKLAKPPISDKLRQLYANATLGELFALKTHSSALLSRLSELHLLDKNIKIGVCNVVPSAKDDFFEATQQLISTFENMGEGIKSFIVFPVVVFDGEIYEFFQQENDLKVLPINHVQFVSFEKSMTPCMIDVVRKTYFPTFLQIIENDFMILSDIISYKGEG